MDGAFFGWVGGGGGLEMRYIEAAENPRGGHRHQIDSRAKGDP